MSPVTRPLVEFVGPQDVEPRLLALPAPFGTVEGRPYAGDPEAGDGAALVDLPAGWHGGGAAAGPLPFACELVAFDGGLAADGLALGRHGYLAAPAGTPAPALTTGAAPVRVWVDFIAGVTEALVVPGGEEGWTSEGGLVPGPPPGLTRKPIRGQFGVPCGFFIRIPAGWHEDRVEWHDCAEAALCLDGDLWNVRAHGGAGGTMRRGSYFWRPRHVLHSPMGSDTGCELYISVDGELYNHYLHSDGPPPGPPETRQPVEPEACPGREPGGAGA